MIFNGKLSEEGRKAMLPYPIKYLQFLFPLYDEDENEIILMKNLFFLPLTDTIQYHL